MFKEYHKVKKYGSQNSIQLPKTKSRLVENDEVVILKLDDFNQLMKEYNELKNQIPNNELEKDNQQLQLDLKNKNSEIVKLEDNIKHMKQQLQEFKELQIKQEYVNKELEQLRLDNEQSQLKLEVYENQQKEYLQKDQQLQLATIELENMKDKLIDHETLKDDLKNTKAIIIENNTTISNLNNYIDLIYNRGLLDRILNNEPKQKYGKLVTRNSLEQDK